MTIIAIFLTVFFGPIFIVAFIMGCRDTPQTHTRAHTLSGDADDTTTAETHKGQVQLNGAVNTQADSDHVLELARNVHTVEDVPILRTH